VQSVSLRIDVAHLTPFRGGVEAAAWLFAPPCGARANGGLLVCLHGATCDHRYFHAQFDHHPGYSFAEFFTRLGYHVLAIDHLGMGTSSRPEPERLLTREVVAAADEHVVREVLAGLASGRWFGREPASAPRAIGIAHSLGGMLAVVQQARHRTFERMAVLGWSNIGVRFEGGQARGMSDAAAHEGYLPAPRALTRTLFHLPDVPADLIEEDDARAGLTPANLGRAAMAPGVVAHEAAQIDCPVLLLYGEVDTSPDPHAEVGFYRACREITLTLLRGSAHMHNYASTRREGWHRIERWIESDPPRP
jgi:alpha-beta hydrolase superfamily lysophospholipase